MEVGNLPATARMTSIPKIETCISLNETPPHFAPLASFHPLTLLSLLPPQPPTACKMPCLTSYTHTRPRDIQPNLANPQKSNAPNIYEALLVLSISIFLGEWSRVVRWTLRLTTHTQFYRSTPTDPLHPSWLSSRAWKRAWIITQMTLIRI